jgi:hypothetical protein
LEIKLTLDRSGLDHLMDEGERDRYVRAGKVDEHGATASKNESGKAEFPIIHTESTFREDQENVGDDDDYLMSTVIPTGPVTRGRVDLHPPAIGMVRRGSATN